MNRPEETASKIRHCLEDCSIKKLVVNFRAAQHERTEIRNEFVRLARTTSVFTAKITADIERCQAAIDTEKLVTTELHKLVSDRRLANNHTLQDLEVRNAQLHSQLAKLRMSKLDKLKVFDEKLRSRDQLLAFNGLDSEQQSYEKALEVLSTLPLIGVETELTIEERWQRIGLITESIEEPYVPLTQKFSELNEFLV